ncbi:hypothetical protein [Kordiimonas aquimaris]|uniref:hypothetical protein n=1 Tax=Kordiimonas aquimaris TaxID=707591 RepID=UPI0021D29999|nr:hypothetical protein [Kordiimonas aquimaris]
MKKLILHIGTHRCGSTAIQTMLDGLRSKFEENNISIVMRSDMERGVLDFRRLHRFNRLNPMWIYKLRRLADDIKRSASHTIVVSEENIMGTMPGVLSPDFYPYFPRLIGSFAFLVERLAPEWTVCPRLVVRRQDHYLESVYAFRVSRGLTLGFNDFLAQIDISSLSWVPFLDQLINLRDVCNVKIAALEMWHGDSAAKEAARFLEISDVEDMEFQRLRGNRRHDPEALTFILACNRMGIDGSQVFDAKQASLIDCAALVEQLGDQITPQQRSQLISEISKPVELGFSASDRNSFLAVLEDQNNEFLNHESVISNSAVWG